MSAPRLAALEVDRVAMVAVVRRAVRSVVIGLSLASMACAATPAPVLPGPITSAEIASALTRPREHPEAPLVVHDTSDQPHELSLDQRVLGPSPPDGSERVTSLRVLAEACASAFGPLPGPGPCWLDHPFTVAIPTSAAVAPEPPTKDWSPLERSLGAVFIVGALSGTILCGLKCPEPWDTAVPIGVGTLVLATVVVGAVLVSKSIVVR